MGKLLLIILVVLITALLFVCNAMDKAESFNGYVDDIEE